MSDPTATFARSRRGLVWLLLWALLVIAAGIGLRDPWPSDEPRFNLVAKTMWESGEFLITQRGVELYSDKPPMYMWMQVAGYAVTGSWRVAFLLPSLLAALGVLWLVHDLARRLWSRRAAWCATALLLFTLHFTFQAKRAQIDMALLLLITLSLYGLLRHLLRGPDWGWYWLGWFAAGIGTITKGVGGLALLILLPWAFAHARGWRGLAPLPAPWRDWRWWPGPLFLLAAMALWLLPMLAATYGSGDPARIAYADDLLFRQTAQRYVQSWDHHEPGWYFLGVIATLWLPLSLLLPWLLPAWWRRLRRRDARFLLPLVWAMLIVVFFSLSPGKRDVYILPALPMVLLAAAPLLPGVLRRAAPNRLLFALALLLGAVLFGGGLAALLGEPGFELREEAKRALDPASDALWWMAAVSGALAVLGALIAGPRRGLLGWAASLSVVWMLAYGVWGLPLLNDHNSARGVMQEARRRVGPEIELGLVAWQEQNLLQALPPVTTFGFEKIPWGAQWQRGQTWVREQPAQRRLFVLERMLDDCVDRARIDFVGVSNRRRWYLVGADALRADCVAAPAPVRD